MWFLDGQFVDASVDQDLFHSVKFGFGIFETVLCRGERPLHLEAHLSRMRKSATTLGLRMKEFDFRSQFATLAEKYNTPGQLFRGNIFLTGANESHIVVTITPYTPQPEDAVELTIYPHAHSGYLNKHKTMNYMHNMLARKYAAGEGKYDAVLLDSAGHWTETSTANLLFRDDIGLLTPSEDFLLEGIALQQIAHKYPVRRVHISTVEIASMHEAYITNSLIGALPVKSIGVHTFKPDMQRAKDLRELVIFE